MKLTKKQNPFDVQIGQVWKAKDYRRKRKFSVVRIELSAGEVVAICKYEKPRLFTMINLFRFNKYKRVK